MKGSQSEVGISAPHNLDTPHRPVARKTTTATTYNSFFNYISGIESTADYSTQNYFFVTFFVSSDSILFLDSHSLLSFSVTIV